ncbi:ABC transporter ATP-binding protein [Ruegeria sp.]|uniref:ABC transporter ATP-binding protein n=1 Tax=Ruegeria sp. TaxID=1879320 RepID=UPI002317212A|nr:ABC transporter ATP-binding protein [Ruegeria sp.]MDA7964314.1 ABC transporter ATP-binding protein [Ruegeria sp.]
MRDTTDKEPLLQIRGISKAFGSVMAVDNIDLDIREGEVFSLLGGSGSGKSTLLRMLAGFETPTSGQILLDGKDLADLPPHKRPVNMMFQSYALFPHMTVEKNVAYGLVEDRIPKSEIRDRVSEILDTVQMSEFAKRKPDQLSGGQRQRVALARSLVKMPRLLLLDEPLGALDKRLRESTQFELQRIQEKIGITFIIVTHDQEEAMSLSDRLAVMNQGRLMQIGSPTDVYENPHSRFVADFLGSCNVLDAEVTGESGSETRLRLLASGAETVLPYALDHPAGDKIQLVLRPEKLIVARREIDPGSSGTILKAEIAEIGYLGHRSILHLQMDDGTLFHAHEVSLNRRNRSPLQAGDKVNVTWDGSDVAVVSA